MSPSRVVEKKKKIEIDEKIGSMVGFSQVYNFSRWFRNVTGTTPFRYRQGRLS